MAAEVDEGLLPRRRQARLEPAARELLKAADMIRGAIQPVALAGNNYSIDVAISEELGAETVST